jgi:hypothetical protein
VAAPAWATDLTDIQTDPSATTNWTALGGGAAGLNAETDDYVQGAGSPNSCISKNAWTNALKGMIYVPGGSWTIPTDGVIMAWIKYMAPPSLDTKANGGLQIIVGSSSSDYDQFYFGGNDTLIFETWQPVVVDPNNATADNTVGTPSGTEAALGCLAYLPTTAGPTKGSPLLIDALRYGRHTLEYTLGDGSPNYNRFDLAEATANSTANRWGNIEFNKGAYFVQGFHSFGTSGTAVDFRDSNKVIFIRASGANNLTNDAVSTGYNRFEILNASSNVDWDNIIFQALGTRARGVFVHTAGTFDATFCQFVDVDTFSLLAASVMTDCIFRRTNAITAPGSDLRRSSVLTPTVAADTGAVVWNSSSNPNGKLDDMVFTKGTNAHHAIEFGTSAPTTMTLVGHSYSGFNAANGQNDSTLLFPDTGSDTTWTVNISGGDTPTYKKARAGDTVNIVSSVTVTLTGLVDGTEVRVYKTSDDSVVDGIESTSGGSWAFSAAASLGVYMRIFHVSYYPADIIGYTIPGTATSIPVSQVFDRNYENP